MEHQFTIYYLVGGRDHPDAELKLFTEGIKACQQYECDYRQFDPVYGVLVCRKKDESGKFCEEFNLPVPFYIGEIMHTGVQERHELQMKKEGQVQAVMEEITRNGNKPHNGPDAQ